MGVGEDQAVRTDDETRSFAARRHLDLWRQAAKPLLEAAQKVAHGIFFLRLLRIAAAVPGSVTGCRYFSRPANTDIHHRRGELSCNAGHVWKCSRIRHDRGCHPHRLSTTDLGKSCAGDTRD